MEMDAAMKQLRNLVKEFGKEEVMKLIGNLEDNKLSSEVILMGGTSSDAVDEAISSQLDIEVKIATIGQVTFPSGYGYFLKRVFTYDEPNSLANSLSNLKNGKIISFTSNKVLVFEDGTGFYAIREIGQNNDDQKIVDFSAENKTNAFKLFTLLAEHGGYINSINDVEAQYPNFLNVDSDKIKEGEEYKFFSEDFGECTNRILESVFNKEIFSDNIYYVVLENAYCFYTEDQLRFSY